MTRRQRAQVVELLRCAADIGMHGTVAPLTEASHRTGRRSTPIETLADSAIGAVIDGLSDPWWSDGWDDYACHCLEAAARVEAGEWP